MIIPLAAIRNQVKHRPEGYYEDVVSRGTIVGETLVLDDAAYTELLIKYRRRGLGDKVAAIAKPIARTIDGVLGTDLANCGGCDERQKWLNEKFPSL